MRLPSGELSLLNLAARFLDPGLYLISEFKLIFEVVVNPLAQLFHFGSAQPGNYGFNLLNRAHG